MNLPVLWQNCLLQFGTEIARKAWLWAADAFGDTVRADKYAGEVQLLVTTLRPWLETGFRAHDASDEVLDDLLRFILRRHANHVFGGNINPPFLR